MAYATRADLYRYGAAETMLGDVEREDQESALEAASTWAESLIRGQVTVPVRAVAGVYPVDLVRAICQVVAYDLLSVRGFSEEAFEANMRGRANDSRAWLKGIGDGSVHPGWADSSPDGAAGYDGPLLVGPDGETPGSRGL